MRRTLIWGLVVLVVVAAAAGGVYYYKSTETLGIPSGIYGGKNPEPGSYVPAPATPPVVASSTSPVTGYVKVLAITPTSIKAQTGNSSTSTKTFSFIPNMPVYSVVFSGQTGKGLADVAIGSTVKVFTKGDPTVAVALAFPRSPSLALTAEETKNVVSGKVTALTSASVTIAPADASLPVTIALNSSTNIVTTVRAGEKGRDMVVGDTVAASGVKTAGGVTTAKLILLAPAPLQN